MQITVFLKLEKCLPLRPDVLRRLGAVQIEPVVPTEAGANRSSQALAFWLTGAS
jgi:hypothetical protein